MSLISFYSRAALTNPSLSTFTVKLTQTSQATEGTHYLVCAQQLPAWCGPSTVGPGLSAGAGAPTPAELHLLKALPNMLSSQQLRV